MRHAPSFAEPIDTAVSPSVERTARRAGTTRRALTVGRHVVGLALGALVDRVRTHPPRGLRGLPRRFAAAVARRLVRRELVDQPVATQLRQRLEMLGPAFIKLGQTLAVRRDLLPESVTGELGGLLGQLPAIPFDRFRDRVEAGLGQLVDDLFSWVETRPIGSASIAQIHRASTHEGDAVIIKVVKPGIRDTLERDARLLRFFGRLLELPWSRFQPRRVIDELVTYTLYEVDLVREADHAETFTAHFADQPDVVFPRVYRHLSSREVLTMEFFAGVRPDSRAAGELTESERRRIVDLGAEAVVRMIYRDGFFHADLHPGNLLVLKGPRAGFIDLGMIGRLGATTRRTLLSYYYCLIMGDAEGAARYLSSVAEPARRADPEGFRRATADLSRRFHARNDGDASLAQLILESIGLGGRYRMFFPVEMVLMVKALVTFEGVGRQLVPDFDVAAVSRRHVATILLAHLSPLRVARDGLRLAPELVDALSRAPLLVTEGLRLLERSAGPPGSRGASGLGGAIFGGFALVAGALVAVGAGPSWLAGGLFLTGLVAVLLPRR